MGMMVGKTQTVAIELFAVSACLHSTLYIDF